MSDDLYRFDIVDSVVLRAFEFDDGIWEPEAFEPNETATFDAATGSVTVSERYIDHIEIKVYLPTVAGGADYTLLSKAYTDLDGQPLLQDPAGDDDEGEDEDGDGFDDDDIDKDGFDDDDIDGSADDDVIDGRDGDDSIDGADGDDDLDGGLGDDSLVGGAGDDSLEGRGGHDDLSGGEGQDVLKGGGGDDDVTGGGGDDSLVGGSGDDRCWGGAGSDSVLAGPGDDSIDGGSDAGDDHYSGGLGIDEVDYGGAAAAVAVSLAAGRAVSRDGADGAGIGSDTLRGIENLGGSRFDDRLVGNGQSNRLEGGGGDDSIQGGAGGDTLVGGRGSDRLDGGDDDVRDVFDFNHAADSRTDSADRVVNFDSGIDTIDLRSIDADTSRAGNQAFRFGGHEPTPNGVWAVQSGTSTMLYGDVTGDGQADFAIQLVGVGSIVAADVLL